MKKFNKAILGSLVVFGLFLLFSGLAFNWCLQDLSNFGQFVGGIASTIALLLVAYGLIIQQKEYITSVREQKEQTETLKSANEAQLFYLHYDTLSKIPDQISCTGPGLNPTVYTRLDAIDFLCDTYNRQPSLANLRPLATKFSTIEAFVSTYLQTLRFITSSTDTPRKRLLADLVTIQFQSTFGKIARVESQANKLGLNTQVLQEINTIIGTLNQR